VANPGHGTYQHCNCTESKVHHDDLSLPVAADFSGDGRYTANRQGISVYRREKLKIET
jgi:hypothetical protein